MDPKKYEMPDSREAEISRYLHAKAAKNGVCISTTFELTSACNFSCRMCYVHNTDCGKNRKYELSTEQWLDIAAQAKDAGVMFVLLTGGEPLLREDFCEIYEKMSEMGFVISINSNLSLLNEKHIKSFRKYPPNRINASLYGMSGETYLDLCGTDAYEAVIANIAKLREFNIPVKINSSITPRNLRDFEKIYNYCISEKLIQRTAFYMYPSIRLNNDAERLQPEEVAENQVKNDFLRLSKERFLERADKVEKGIEFIENSDCIDDESKGSTIRCRAGSSTSWIDWRGNMTFCGMVPADPECSVIEKGFTQCWEKTKARVKLIFLPAKCTSCKYKFVCNVCAAACLCEMGAFDKAPEFVCRIAESTVEKYREYKEKLTGEE